jgi:hypothetical protein
MMQIGEKGTRLVCFSRKKATAIASTGILALLSGCERAPTFNIVGSFFPAWLFCVIAGITLAAVLHWVFTKIEIDKHIKPSILVYPCLAASFACALWLIIFS